MLLLLFNIAHADSRTFENPIALPDFQTFLTAIANMITIIGVPIIMFFIILAGFRYVTAQGNPEQIKTASRALLYALIGGVVLIGANALAAIIADTATRF